MSDSAIARSFFAFSVALTLQACGVPAQESAPPPATAYAAQQAGQYTPVPPPLPSQYGAPAAQQQAQYSPPPQPQYSPPPQGQYQPPPGGEYGAPPPDYGQAPPPADYGPPPPDYGAPPDGEAPPGEYVDAGVVTAPEPPPPLPEYDQPDCPGPGYLWTPGYWAYSPDGYYWVPGTWVFPPAVGLLWTPGFWAWSGAVFVFHTGYWGHHVGYYGGIDYGHGYGGYGYDGGRWVGNQFHYNAYVTRVNTSVIHNTYNSVVVNRPVNRISYNGGRGGLAVRPTAQEQGWMREQHFRATAPQVQNRSAASQNRSFFASQNHGTPPVAATPRARSFPGREAMPSHGPAVRPGFATPQRETPKAGTPWHGPSEPQTARPSVGTPQPQYRPPQQFQAPAQPRYEAPRQPRYEAPRQPHFETPQQPRFQPQQAPHFQPPAQPHFQPPSQPHFQPPAPPHVQPPQPQAHAAPPQGHHQEPRHE